MNLANYIERQKHWSAKTFGPGTRKLGVIEHIKKELEELQKDSHENEWIDVMILAFDGAWRSGLTPQEIECALEKKQEKNMAREWPDWRDFTQDRAIEHVRTEEKDDAAISET